MIEIGKWQTLQVRREKDFGIYLGDDEDSDEAVLLPKKQVPEGTKTGDCLRVFIYRDSEDRLIATTNTPLITLEEIAVLKVISVGSIGAFMDWGLEKDILLPFKEQTGKVEEGNEYLVRMYVDKSSRLCVSMRLYDDLSCESPYKKDDEITGIVYQLSEQLGALVAVDSQYSALIPKQEIKEKISLGQRIQGRVSEVRPDGKLNISMRRLAHLQIEEDSEKILEVIASYDGVLPFTDKVGADVIERELALSKNAFKRAVGKLLKEKKIQITENSIIRL